MRNDKGLVTTYAPSTYKIPTAGEPPFMLAISVYEALRDAIASVRGSDKPVRLTAPATAENVPRALAG